MSAKLLLRSMNLSTKATSAIGDLLLRYNKSDLDEFEVELIRLMFNDMTDRIKDAVKDQVLDIIWDSGVKEDIRELRTDYRDIVQKLSELAEDFTKLVDELDKPKTLNLRRQSNHDQKPIINLRRSIEQITGK